MGKISYELYLYHGIVFLCVQKNIDLINNDYKTAIAFGVTLLIASVINQIDLFLLGRKA